MDSLYHPSSTSSHLPLFLSQQLGEMSRYSYSSLTVPEASATGATAINIPNSPNTNTFTRPTSTLHGAQKKRNTGSAEASKVFTPSKRSKNKRQKTIGDDKDACRQTPEGYVPVRAKRGQATDSHSLAERVRRERISERMKMLQELVPGCAKVNGKAHMLDEIINYVQSLQHQIEFLSMKLASLSPMWYNFATDFDDCIYQADKLTKMSITQQGPLVDQANNNQLHPQAYSNGITNNMLLMDHAVPVLLQEQRATLSFNQDSASFVAQAGGERQVPLINQIQQPNLCTFHYN